MGIYVQKQIEIENYVHTCTSLYHISIFYVLASHTRSTYFYTAEVVQQTGGQPSVVCNPTVDGRN